jgi:hypothetical protein
MYESPQAQLLIQRAVRAGAPRVEAPCHPHRWTVVLLTVRLDERRPGLPGLSLPARGTVATNTSIDEQV